MKSQAKIQTIGRVACMAIAIAFVATTAAQAQVPRDVAAKLVEIGKGVCVPQTAKLYAPLQPKPPASGITIVRDISYADDPRTIMDVFSAEKGGGSRPYWSMFPAERAIRK